MRFTDVLLTILLLLIKTLNFFFSEFIDVSFSFTRHYFVIHNFLKEILDIKETLFFNKLFFFFFSASEYSIVCTIIKDFAEDEKMMISFVN